SDLQPRRPCALSCPDGTASPGPALLVETPVASARSSAACRQCERESRPAAGDGTILDAAAQRLDHRTANAQPQAQPARLRGDERLEEPVADLGGHAVAPIRDGERHAT